MEQQLIRVHWETFEPAARPVVEIGPIDEAAIQQHHAREATKGISALRLRQRREALEAGRASAQAEVEELTEAREQELTRQQTAANRTWQQLLANDPVTVINVLDQAFEDNDATAAPLDCEGDGVTMMMLMPPVSAVPTREAHVTAAGTPTLRNRSKTEINRMYRLILASNLMATVLETFAVAPSINLVQIVVADLDEGSLTALYVGVFDRPEIEALDIESPAGLLKVYSDRDACFRLGGRTKELLRLTTDDHPDIQRLLNQIADGLRRAAESGDGSFGAVAHEGSYDEDAVTSPAGTAENAAIERRLIQLTDDLQPVLGRAAGVATAEPDTQPTEEPLAREPVAAGKGSQRRMQEWVEWHADELDRRLQGWDTLNDWRDAELQWISPLRADGYRELRDDLWTATGLPSPTPQQDGLWPRRGPVWDAVALVPHGDERGVLLVEAKSHVAELESSASAASAASLERIQAAMTQTKTALGVAAERDWTGRYYQLANRLAFLSYMRGQRQLPVWLLSIYFTGDSFQSGGAGVVGPTDQVGWEQALNQAKSSLGLPDRHGLSDYTMDLFLPAAPSALDQEN